MRDRASIEAEASTLADSVNPQPNVTQLLKIAIGVLLDIRDLLSPVDRPRRRFPTDAGDDL